MIWAYDKCNGINTADFLERIAKWTSGCPNVTVIWDGSPVHRARVAQERGAKLGIELVLLPGYSPDLNPIDGLWKWMRESLTNGHCHDSVESLLTASIEFVANINRDPVAMINRLWPKMDLVEEEEKLRIPK